MEGDEALTLASLPGRPGGEASAEQRAPTQNERQEMDARAAKGIAACIRKIAEATAQIAMIDSIHGDKPNFVYVDRVDLVREVEKAEASIASWLQQPMTWR